MRLFHVRSKNEIITKCTLWNGHTFTPVCSRYLPFVIYFSSFCITFILYIIIFAWKTGHIYIWKSRIMLKIYLFQEYKTHMKGISLWDSNIPIFGAQMNHIQIFFHSNTSKLLKWKFYFKLCNKDVSFEVRFHKKTLTLHCRTQN